MGIGVLPLTLSYAGGRVDADSQCYNKTRINK
jgi:hypothetical protein